MGTAVNGLAAEAGGTVVAVGEDNGATLVRRVAPDGTVVQSFDAGKGAATGVAIQSNGGIVVVGTDRSTELAGFVRRFTTDGQPDPAFGQNGAVPLTTMTPRAVAMAPGGRIVIGGSLSTRDGADRGGLVRLLPDGRGDAGFGRSGVTTFDIGRYSRVNAVVAQPDGRILFAGQRAPDLRITTAVAGRTTLDGRLDRSFNATGIFVHDAGGSVNARFNGLALEPSGAVLLAGAEVHPDGTQAPFVRLTPEGRLDPGFGMGGVTRLPSSVPMTISDPVGAMAVAVAGGGEIVGVGGFQDSGQRSEALWALTASGAPDKSVAPGGLVRIRPDGVDGTEASALTVTPAGALTAGGRDQDFNGPDAGVVRFAGGFGTPPVNPLSEEVPVVAPAQGDRRPARLAVSRAVVVGRTLRVTASLTYGATGVLRGSYEANGTRSRFTARIAAGNRVTMMTRTLSARARRGGRGLVRLSYGGSGKVRPASALLRAGPRSSGLRVRKAAVDPSSFLVVAGSAGDRTTGTVLVRMSYVAPDGRLVKLDYRAPVRRRIWRVEERLPDAAAAAGGEVLVRYVGLPSRGLRGVQDSRLVGSVGFG
ncbi:MAG: enzyme repeat protein [Solirubrobacterales bacterium]|nr:enzyme repeat protein [Solirubrobacterales bacterium]